MGIKIRIWQMVSLLAIVLSMSACGGSDSSTTKAPETSPSTQAAQTLTLRGKLLQADDGLPAAAAKVEWMDGVAMATSDANGDVVLQLPLAESTQDRRFSLRISGAQILTSVKHIDLVANETEVSFRLNLLARAASQTANFSLAQSLSGESGAAVSFPAEAFVLPDGTPATGSATASITPIDITRPEHLDVVSGSLNGQRQAGSEISPLISYGMVDYEFRQNGQLLQLAADKKATITMPLFVDQLRSDDGTLRAVQANDQIDLWYFDESDGVWKGEGQGKVVANGVSPTGWALEAEVSHFTPWNTDDLPPWGDIRWVVRPIDSVTRAPINLPVRYKVSVSTGSSYPGPRWSTHKSGTNTVDIRALSRTELNVVVSNIDILDYEPVGMNKTSGAAQTNGRWNGGAAQYTANVTGTASSLAVIHLDVLVQPKSELRDSGQ